MRYYSVPSLFLRISNSLIISAKVFHGVPHDPGVPVERYGGNKSQKSPLFFNGRPIIGTGRVLLCCGRAKLHKGYYAAGFI